MTKKPFERNSVLLIFLNAIFAYIFSFLTRFLKLYLSSHKNLYVVGTTRLIQNAQSIHEEETWNILTKFEWNVGSGDQGNI